MSEKKDYYKILGISDEDKKKTGKDFDKILKKAFRSMAVKYHPDKWVNASEEERAEAEAKFKEANEANDVLSDSQKREMYDLYGTLDAGRQQYNGGMGDIDEMMRNFARAHGFDMGYTDSGKRTITGSDVKVRVRISVKDIIENATKTFRYKRLVPCSHCDGTGTSDKSAPKQCQHCGGTGQYVKRRTQGNMFFEQRTTCPYCGGNGISISNPCSFCSGTGLEKKDAEETIKIPQGVTHDTFITIQGGGNFPERGDGVPGNLHILFTVDDDGEYSMMDGKMYDIVRKVNISVLDFLTGCKFKIKTPYGDEKEITVKSCEKDGKMYCITGKGLKNERGICGDMYIKLVMEMPEKLNDEEKKNIEGLKECENFKFLTDIED